MSNAPEKVARRHRIEVRVTEEQDALIREAADLERESVTSFVLDTVTERARRVIEDRNTVTLENEAFDRFYATLDGPPTVVPELVELFRRDRIARR